RAGDRAAGAVAASDAFFPFPDGLVVLAEAGVRAIAEPGGSIRDDQVIAAARAAGVSLYFTGVRHFSHLSRQWRSLAGCAHDKGDAARKRRVAGGKICYWRVT